MRGWVNYFGLADMKIMLKTDGRMVTPQNKGDLLETMEEKQVHRHANNRHGIWCCSGLQYLNYVMNNKQLREWGYPSFTEFYLKICEN
jgi:RNA-directed DNA polymerase